MRQKVFGFLLIAALLLCSACAGKPALSGEALVPATTEIIEIYDDPYVPFYTADLAEVVNRSDTIIIGRVEETLPGELFGSGDSKYVKTPANIRVIQSLKGDHASKSVLKIVQYGGVAEGVDFRPVSMNLHTQGETYLFFIDSGCGVLHSEHVIHSDALEGYFFTDKTVDDAVSIIMDCVKNGRMTIDTQQIKSFCFGIDGPEGDLVYYIDKTELDAQVTLNGVANTRNESERWDAAKWDAFIADLDHCGVFNWEKHYDAASYSDFTYWGLDLETDIGYLIFQGTDAYPDEWDAFLSVIDEYFGTVE